MKFNSEKDVRQFCFIKKTKWVIIENLVADNADFFSVNGDDGDDLRWQSEIIEH